MKEFILNHYAGCIVFILVVFSLIIAREEMKDDSNWIDENDNPIPPEVIRHKRFMEKEDKRMSRLYH